MLADAINILKTLLSAWCVLHIELLALCFQRSIFILYLHWNKVVFLFNVLRIALDACYLYFLLLFFIFVVICTNSITNTSNTHFVNVFLLHVQKKEADGGNQITCKPKRDDYLECLHHKKEKLRADAISAEAARQAAGGGSNGHGSHGGH